MASQTRMCLVGKSGHSEKKVSRVTRRLLLLPLTGDAVQIQDWKIGTVIVVKGYVVLLGTVRYGLQKRETGERRWSG